MRSFVPIMCGKIFEAVVEACPPHTGRPMRWVSLLERMPAPIGEDIRNGLAGDFCLCTGYIKIFEAVVEACRLTRGAA